MPRKKQKSQDIHPQAEPPQAAVIEVKPDPNAVALQRPAYLDGPPTTPDGKTLAVAQNEDAAEQQPAEKKWGPPYKAIFTSTDKGFEMGENRRFKQRVFKFSEKPDAETIAVLKDNGFTYRPEEKTWTIQADNTTRQLADKLAAKFAGASKDITR